jgi:hypothetical protein
MGYRGVLIFTCLCQFIFGPSLWTSNPVTLCLWILFSVVNGSKVVGLVILMGEGSYLVVLRCIAEIFLFIQYELIYFKFMDLGWSLDWTVVLSPLWLGICLGTGFTMCLVIIFLCRVVSLCCVRVKRVDLVFAYVSTCFSVCWMTILFLVVRICCVIGQEGNFSEILCEILVISGCAIINSGLLALHWYSIE